MEEWFGNVINGEMHLSGIGHIASQMWYDIPVHFPFIDLVELVVGRVVACNDPTAI